MLPIQKRIFALLLVISAAAFILYIPPNAAASQNLSMVQMFEPDEAAPLPYVFQMIAPAKNLDQALRGFVFYNYYYYGFPYFALSALLILPVQWVASMTNLPLVMLVLRQFVSVLPMLTSLLLLVYLQDGFRSYRSPVLFVFLLCVPAVMENNFWWHPDGITFLLVVLTLFFLRRDDLRFGRNFLIAAALSGVVTATKLIGVYFFLAVGLALFLGLLLKKASWKKLGGLSLAYLLVMAVAFVAANPFLLSHWARTAYIYTFNKQTALLSEGYGIAYAKGLAAAWPTMRQYYGSALFLVTALGAALWGAFHGPRRLLYALILAWLVPVSVSILWLTHFKFQYWLPVALPLFSCLAVLLPEKLGGTGVLRPTGYLQGAVLGVVLVQSILFLGSDVQNYTDRLNRAENNPRIQFYHQAVAALASLPPGPLSVYYDYRLYAPQTPGWTTETNYELLEYGYIQEKNFDVLLLLEQRIRDYLNPNATGIDPDLFALNQQFYRDADQGTITGYRLVYRDAVGLVFLRDGLAPK
jgi:hypothetical protein